MASAFTLNEVRNDFVLEVDENGSPVNWDSTRDEAGYALNMLSANGPVTLLVGDVAGTNGEVWYCYAQCPRHGLQLVEATCLCAAGALDAALEYAEKWSLWPAQMPAA